MRRDVLLPALLLLAAALLGHLGALTRDVWTGTEPFRVLVGHEMARSGDWLVPRLGGEVVLTKPPLFYWIAAGIDRAAGGLDMFWLRLPSVLALWLAAVAVCGSVRRLAGATAGLVAGLGTILAPNLVWHGGFAEIDPLFAGFAAVSIVWLAEAVAGMPRARSAARGASDAGNANGGTDPASSTTDRPAASAATPRARLVAAGLAGALAMLTKGPPLLMFAIGVGVVWWRHARLRGIAWFAVPLLAPIATYYLLVTFASSVTAEQFAAVAAAESVGRVAHFGWRALLEMPAHPLKAFAVVLPFAIWLPRALARGADPDRPDRLFTRALAWSYVAAVAVLLVFPRRPVRYLLPGVPLVVAATAPWVASWLSTPGPLPKPVRIGFRLFGGAAAIGMVAAPWLEHPLPGRTVWALAAIAFAGTLIRGRIAAFAAILLLPVLLTWTALRDREHVYGHGERGEQQLAAWMREELDVRDIDSFEFWGNPGEGFALHLDPAAVWRDRGPRVTTARWLVTRVYDGEVLAPPDGVWHQRVRLRGRERTYLLLERG